MYLLDHYTTFYLHPFLLKHLRNEATSLLQQDSGVIGLYLGTYEKWLLAPRLMAEPVLNDLKSFEVFDEDELRTIARKSALELSPRLEAV
ncbi:MAG: hypothetical protein ACFFEU_15385 [Candidatus Thorarchaeota archaeon]